MDKDIGKSVLMLVIPPFGGTSLMWSVRLNEVTVFEFWAAAVLLFAAWAPYYRWKLAKERRLPLFPMFSFMLWVYYALPLFWGDRWGYTRGQLSHRWIEQAMLLAVVGVVCVAVGKWIGIGRRLVSRNTVEIHSNQESTWSYIRAALMLTLPLAFLIESHSYLFGTGGRQAFIYLASIVPTALFVMLFRQLLSYQANMSEILLIGLFLLCRLVAGLASGWLGHSVGILVICAVAYVYERRRVPPSAVLIVLVFILFFQAGKYSFRQAFWGERVDASFSQKVSFWSSESLRNWEFALQNPEEGWRPLAAQSLSRLSLLQQTAHVIELTPYEVPYQHGRLYSYMLVTLIPRAIWPDKPEVSGSSRFYQVAYGMTKAKDLAGVSIAVGTVAESFINFGWWGPFIVMIPLGMFFDYFEHAFLARDSGSVLNAIGIALIPNFLTLESQMAQFVGGIVQSIGVILLVLWPVLHWQVRGQSARGRAVEPVIGGIKTPLAIQRRYL